MMSLPVMEHFYTLQGEGYYSGRAAYFVRLGGCDVGCVWCDVKESWNKDAHPVMSTNAIVQEIVGSKSPMAVITGGEPLMHQLDELTAAIKAHGVETNIETSGSWPMSGHWDWVCLSPKKFKAPLPENLVLANELKVIVFNQSDFAWAEQYAAQVSTGCKLYLQPEWSRRLEMTPRIIEYIKANPKWEISMQVHKYLDIP